MDSCSHVKCALADGFRNTLFDPLLQCFGGMTNVLNSPMAQELWCDGIVVRASTLQLVELGSFPESSHTKRL